MERKSDIAEERRQQIMEGALQVFSTKGFVKATNKDVAEAAGIQSPGLIYHYFKDKADLLRAVIERFAPPLQLLTHAEEIQALPLREALTRFGMLYLGLVEEPKIRACMKLLLGEAIRNPDFAQILGRIGPLRVLQFITEYLQKQMDVGRLRRTDPQLAARAFIGPLIVHILAQNLFQLPEQSPRTNEAIIETTVDIFLNGMTPD